MSLLFRRQEQRAISYQDLWGSGADVRSVSADSVSRAARVVPVYAAWRLLADSVASLTLRAYRQGSDGTRQQLSAQPQLCTAPTAHGSVFDWKQRAVMSLLSKGNTVGYITQRDGRGTATMVEWLNVDRVELMDNHIDPPRWFYDGRPLNPLDVVHIPAMQSPDCLWGISPLKAFMTVFETGLSAQESARDWFVNGALPSVHFKNTAQTLSADEARFAKDRYREAVRGREALATGSDWEVIPVGLPADEQRFIEQQRMTATQVASIYGIPPEMIGGETGSNLTYSTVEQNTLNFVTYALRPWVVRLETALSALLPQPQYVRFNTDSLIRTDTLTRMQAHEIALRTGLETNDEARAIEDRPPLTDAERTRWLNDYRPSPSAPATRGTAPEA